MNIREIEKQIIEIDGSCRNINFYVPQKNYLINLLKFLMDQYRFLSVAKSDGNKISIDNEDCKLDELVSFYNEHINLLLENKNQVIKNPQFFISRGESEDYYLEITFFPNDINRDKFTFIIFVEWLSQILKCGNSKEFYVRYENSSWKYGDSSDDSGVIYSHLK